MKIELSTKQAYQAMLIFLETYYNTTQSNEIAGMLGSMSLNEDGKPMDMAHWEEWVNAVENVNKNR